MVRTYARLGSDCKVHAYLNGLRLRALCGALLRGRHSDFVERMGAAKMTHAFQALGVMGIFYFGTVFGAWMTESKENREAKSEPLMEVVDANSE